MTNTTPIRYGRKRSGMVDELNKKIEDWLESIKDKSTQKLARQNTIVTGGSIASMLLGEPINDFDIYFKTKEATLAVAEYYAGKLDPAFEAKVIDGEDRVTTFIPSSGIASLQENAKKAKKRKKYRVGFISENAITLTDKIQIITRFFGEPTEIHNNYDFIHAQCYWNHKNQHLELPAKALEYMMCRSLLYTGSLYPIASIFRIKKFLERGWRISAGQLLKIMWQISELDLKDPKVLREQLTGVDMLYLNALIMALAGAKPEELTQEYVVSIIDKVFREC